MRDDGAWRSGQDSVPDEALERVCQRHRIRRLALFGSVLRPDFRDDSDVDVLVELHGGAEPGLLRLAQMELELGELLGDVRWSCGPMRT